MKNHRYLLNELISGNEQASLISFQQGYFFQKYFNMREAHTCITEERLKIVIKSMFAEEFQKQEKKCYKCYKWQFRDHYEGNKKT